MAHPVALFISVFFFFVVVACDGLVVEQAELVLTSSSVFAVVCLVCVVYLMYKRVNGDRYEGEWRNGRMHGKGVKVMANGDVYNGTWENDKAEGNGVKVRNAFSSCVSPPPGMRDVCVGRGEGDRC